MAEMREILRSRLAGKARENSAHPDANLLAAFAERTLTERERTAVVAHLMECADCRECVALAFGAAEAEAQVAARPERAGSRFREWRWIVSAASACCVIAGALVYYGEPQARRVPAAVSSEAREERSVTAAPAARMSIPMAPQKKVEPQASGKRKAPAFRATKNELKRTDVLAQALPPAPAPSTAYDAAPSAPQLQAAKAPEISFSAGAPKEKTKNPAAMEASAELLQPRAARSGAEFAVPMRLKDAAAARLLKSAQESPRVLWSIKASPEAGTRGVIERSIDAGQSWEVVPLSERASFRSVANFGRDVWAGGSDGALFHSSDGGGHWEQITVRDEKGKISGDIVRIDVRGPGQVTVVAASGEIWTTVDGKVWVRQ